MSKLSKLESGLMSICARNKDGSHATQANRRSMLSLFVKQLAEANFKVNQLRPSDLKGRHVNALLRIWRAEGVSTGTIKNRLSVLRWWAEKIGNAGAVKSNEDLNIENRVYVTNESKALSLSDFDISNCDVSIQHSLELQAEFGLRREEAMKFQPLFALEGQKIETAKEIRIKPSWSKGGRGRVIPITAESQRAALYRAFQYAGEGSLIPPKKTYKAHVATFEKQTHDIGLGNTHSLRHAYAQRRYEDLMGFACPAIDSSRVLTAEERQKDKDIRLKISEELGHSRINITSIYLGSWRK